MQKMVRSDEENILRQVYQSLSGPAHTSTPWDMGKTESAGKCAELVENLSLKIRNISLKTAKAASRNQPFLTYNI